MKICIVGAGAIGGFSGALFALPASCCAPIRPIRDLNHNAHVVE